MDQSSVDICFYYQSRNSCYKIIAITRIGYQWISDNLEENKIFIQKEYLDDLIKEIEKDGLTVGKI